MESPRSILSAMPIQAKRRSDARSFRATLPSVITSIRLLLLIPFVVLLASRVHPFVAGLILGAMGVTDFLDGYLARHIGAVTAFGKAFDPISDRIVLATVAVAFYHFHVLPTALLLAIVAREAAVTLISGIRALVVHEHTDVVFIGKLGTFSLLTGFPLAVWSTAPNFPDYLRELIFGLVIAGVVLLYAALGIYVRNLAGSMHSG
ncbi:MAG: CDP-alcohol phosphatidyltransferase family protein [Ferrimicrobium sp.]